MIKATPVITSRGPVCTINMKVAFTIARFRYADALYMASAACPVCNKLRESSNRTVRFYYVNQNSNKSGSQR